MVRFVWLRVCKKITDTVGLSIHLWLRSARSLTYQRVCKRLASKQGNPFALYVPVISLQTLIYLQVYSFVILLLLTLFHVSHAAEQATTTPTTNTMYKYINENGVISFTNNLESIPKSLRDQVEIIKKDSLKEVEKSLQKPKWTDPLISALPKGFLQDELKTKALIGFLLVVIGVLILWCLKLWIKNIIFKLVIRALIVIALAGIFYGVIHYLFIAPGNSSVISQKIKEVMAPYVPIEKATKDIKRFEEKEEQKRRTLDVISDP